MTLWHLTRAIAETARICAPTILEGMVGRLNEEICDARLDGWSKAILRQAKVELTVVGLENAPVGETFVVMSNHQSLYDIPVLFQALQRRVRMVAKKELFMVPGWGHAMRMAGFVEVDRQNRHKAIQSLRHAEAALAKGTSIWIAPEGTRSETGELSSFKKGGFHLAVATGARILPVTIVGSRDALLARGFKVTNGAKVTAYVNPPIDPKDFGPERREELMEAVRRAIESRLPYGKSAA
jgi:1-acyl-sn-glycerol-3-phosphate acyltransferase